jgi:AraC-like DNA-binding protein
MDNKLKQTCAVVYSLTAKPNPTHFKNHLHNEYEILFFWQGSAEIIINSNTYKMKKGDLFIIKPAVYHYVKFLSNDFSYERCVINFSQSFVSEHLKKFFNTCNDLYNFEKNHVVFQLFEEWKKIKGTGLFLQDDEDCFNFLKTLPLIISKQQVEKEILPIKTNKTMEEILQYIDENPTEKISAESLAKKFFVSSSWIIHTFKKLLGISLMQYINKKRLLYSQRLMLGGFSPTEACEKCNFADYSTFYRQYKKFFGVSPKNLQK